jgi:hypothetical protein
MASDINTAPGARRAAGRADQAHRPLRCYARGMPTTRTLSRLYRAGAGCGDRLHQTATSRASTWVSTLSASEAGIGRGPGDPRLAGSVPAMDVASILRKRQRVDSYGSGHGPGRMHPQVYHVTWAPGGG